MFELIASHPSRAGGRRFRKRKRVSSGHGPALQSRSSKLKQDRLEICPLLLGETITTTNLTNLTVDSRNNNNNHQKRPARKCTGTDLQDHRLNVHAYVVRLCGTAVNPGDKPPSNFQVASSVELVRSAWASSRLRREETSRRDPSARSAGHSTGSLCPAVASRDLACRLNLAPHKRGPHRPIAIVGGSAGSPWGANFDRQGSSPMDPHSSPANDGVTKQQ